MVLIRLLLLLLLVSGAGQSALAHKDHQKKAAAAKALEQSGSGNPVLHPMSPAVHEAVKEDIDRLEATAALPVHQRLLDWLGRIHPFAVHFPLALFPIGWVGMLLARRRGKAADLLASLLIVAGVSSVLAAGLGWLNAGLAVSDKDPLLLWHRWLGTAIGLAGAAIAALVWRRPSAANSGLMLYTLGGMTLAVLVQGWFGGALIHGIDHLAW